NKATTLGLGFTGKPMANLEIGGNLSFMDDRSEYAQTLDAGAGGEAAALLAATGGLPDTLFRQTTLKLFGRYTLDKQSSIRVDLAHQRTRWTDWAWGYNGVPFAFSDGTTIVRKPTQNVTFIGVTYVRRWP
ncbi:MAG TPA: MtrB/PioB family outer membrane beta-barrel protein, partial [Albitalea sp.]|nr:MtrB/PioB family outer membrane beta-barrel protein [Albitalea sp.]